MQIILGAPDGPDIVRKPSKKYPAAHLILANIPLVRAVFETLS